MKLKKVLAGALAAAMALTTMVTTSFTASADSKDATCTVNNVVLYYTSDSDKVDYCELKISPEEIATAIGEPDAIISSISDVKVNYTATADIASGHVKHNSDAANGYYKDESLTFASGTNDYALIAPVAYDTAAGFALQFQVDDAATNLATNTVTINSVSFKAEFVSEMISAANFKYSLLKDEAMKVGDSFTITYDSNKTPATAKYVLKYSYTDANESACYPVVVKEDGTVDNTAEADTGLNCVVSTSGTVTTYTFTATQGSKYAFKIGVEYTTAGDWSDTQYPWFGEVLYKVASDASEEKPVVPPTNDEIVDAADIVEKQYDFPYFSATLPADDANGNKLITYDDMSLTMEELAAAKSVNITIDCIKSNYGWGNYQVGITLGEINGENTWKAESKSTESTRTINLEMLYADQAEEFTIVLGEYGSAVYEVSMLEFINEENEIFLRISQPLVEEEPEEKPEITTPVIKVDNSFVSFVPANSAKKFEVTDPVTGKAISTSVNNLAKALSKVTDGSELTFDVGSHGLVLRKRVVDEIVKNNLTLTVKTSKATFIIDAENLAKVKTINIPAIMKTTNFKKLVKEGNTFNVIVTEKNKVEIELA